MFGLENIKDLYKPIQPGIKNKDHHGIIYHEIKPEKKLDHLIYCFWQLKTSEPLFTDYTYRVVSDGCIDIFFDHTQTSENYVMGFCRKYTEFPIGKAFDYIGIRFFPSAFSHIFQVSAQLISNKAHVLKCILPQFADLITNQIKATDDFELVIQTLSEYITTVLKDRDHAYDTRFVQSLQKIYQKFGHLNVETELNTGLSARQLRRIYNYYLGTSPKTFCKVVRFQYILNANPSIQKLKDDKLYFNAGFFDQAHFIKDFKTFYGVTPSEAFR